MTNDSDLWRQFWQNLPEPYKAAVLATLVAVLRVFYDGREPRWFRRVLEAALCGAIALAIATLCGAIGLADGWGTFLGASVGLFGADQVREWGRRFASKRIR